MGARFDFLVEPAFLRANPGLELGLLEKLLGVDPHVDRGLPPSLLGRDHRPDRGIDPAGFVAASDDLGI